MNDDRGRRERRAARYKVKMELLMLGSPCPGCWEMIDEYTGADFHHALLREGDALTTQQKVLLYDSRNGLLVHRKCHMEENPVFRRNCAIIIIQRHGGLQAIHEFLGEASLFIRQVETPPVWIEVMDRWDCISHKRCPVCGERKLHAYLSGLAYQGQSVKGPGLLCWGCLRISDDK